ECRRARLDGTDGASVLEPGACALLGHCLEVNSTAPCKFTDETVRRGHRRRPPGWRCLYHRLHAYFGTRRNAGTAPVSRTLSWQADCKICHQYPWAMPTIARQRRACAVPVVPLANGKLKTPEMVSRAS